MPDLLASPVAALVSAPTRPPLTRAVVLGAGIMGAGIAAHLANAGLEVFLLDLPESSGARNAPAAKGLQSALKSRPAAFFDSALARRVKVGNFADNLDAALAGADWVIEAIVENLAIKQELLAQVGPRLPSAAALTTNTSGLSVVAIGAALPPTVRSRWFGTHFFNPPRYLQLLEIISTPESDLALVSRIADFADRRLGKGIVRAHDTPNFIANRIGTFALMTTLRLMREMDLAIEQIDLLTGPALGWPKSATFRTADLVGIDLLAHVVENSYRNLPNDECRETFHLPDFLQEMVRRGWLGDKSGQGFYKKGAKGAGGEREILVLDPKTLEYRARRKAQFPSLELAKNIDDTAERLRGVLRGGDAVGQFLWKLLSEICAYAAARIPEIADSPLEVDRAMRWGFGWQLGPFETWDALGLEATAVRLRREGRPLPNLVARMLAAGVKSFYRNGAADSGVGNDEIVAPATLRYQPVPLLEGSVRLDALRRAGRELRRNASCSLIDLGDGVGCLEFHSKMNALGPDIVEMVKSVIEDPRTPCDAFVVGNDAENFSVGANLMLLLLEVQDENWDDIDLAVRAFQGMTQAIRRSPRPLVVAPAGRALGGGCEIILHAPLAVAHAELYTGLVEVGVGLIPAGGGAKEMTLRAIEAAERVRGAGSRGESVEVQEAIKANFETVALAKVSTSAAEASKLGWLRPDAVIVPNRARVLATAKQEALRLLREGYAPRSASTVPAPGPNIQATLEVGIYLMREADYITEHEQTIARRLARIFTGGDAPAGAPIDEQYLLDLEREAFLSLCGERKTQERMQYTLKTGKPLRN